MKRDLIGLAAIILLAVGSGCTTDPTQALSEGVGGVSASVSYVEIVVGDSVAVTAETKDNQGVAIPDPLPTIASATPAVVSIVEADVPPLAQRLFYIKALTFGEGEVTVTAGGQSLTINVQTWPARIAISGVPDTVRSGATATASLAALDANGNVMEGVAPLTLASSDTDVLALDTATLVVTAIEAGVSTLTASGPNSTGQQAVLVLPAVPASAELDTTTFGAVSAGGTATLELLVLDAAGNQNTNIGEITSAAVNTSDAGVATVAATVVDTADEGTRREIFVTVTGVAAGTADITGSVTTSEGVFAFAATPVTVLDPQVTSTVLASAAGGTVTILGSGFTAAGFTTDVLLDGEKLGNFTVDSDGQITAQMGTFGTAGALDVEVSVGGVLSNAATWTQAADFDELEAVNDAPGTAPAIAAPFEFAGAFEGAPEEDDFFVFTLSKSATIVIDLDWSPAKDLDILVTTGGFSGFVCTNGATGARPERATCALNAGTYYLWLNDFDADANGNTTPVTYTVTGRIQ
jgi:hypothetical protein